MEQSLFITDLDKVGIEDIELVGGKNASLGEMLQHISKLGVQVPNGFVITVHTYYTFLKFSNLDGQIRDLLQGINYDELESLRRAGMQIRTLIRNSKFPPELSKAIIEKYTELSRSYGQEVTDVAVRSSATAEDLPDASFAGQQETYLNVRGPAALINAVRNCFASLFTDRAISYRHSAGYNHFNIGLSVCVQKMVRSDLGASGVAFSLDTESGFRDVVVINATFGLGEMLVQGAVSPDEYIAYKPAILKGYNSIIEKKLGKKDQMMVYGDGPDERVRIIPTDKQLRGRYCLSDERIMQLTRWIIDIENYYTKKRGTLCPMDIEWAVDGLTRELFIVQARPETIHSQKDHSKITGYHIRTHADHKVITKGIAVGDGLGIGKVNILYSMDKRVTEGQEFQAGDILVTDMTDPDWEPIMKKASAIITNKGGRTCHAAIVAREMGVPAIVGCGHATDELTQGQLVTASCAEGDTGIIYEGEVPFEKVETDLDDLPKVKTPIMLNVASPGMAFHYSHFPNAGVGLAREEFIINNFIQAHPLALMKHKELNDPELTEAIQQLTAGYESGEAYFIEKLSFGIARIAAAFYPNKVIVRFSDFKSNEYFNLLGGKYFEPHEENPMIGWRGASRYYSDSYKDAFALECKGIKKVREELGLDNVVVMIPFCRTVEECIRVQEVMKENGLVRGEKGLEVYLMAELPSNIMMAEAFCKYIDGFSIGSNDLTQLTLGLDRDSALVAHIYDERNPAVKAMIQMLIETAKRNKVKVGICGQGPSDFPDFAQFLVELGIDSISVTPDSLVKTVRAIAEVEAKMK
ncbi:MAG TPA: phosphoenolpyruvate synthase [Ferruginibacter sp.]|nr:phosphoenolpyruvate synthase [Ferruginibacter sp.]HRO17192.1 phosphoenolpyruvate synthase [Ferruginibacter sp.]HRQ19779.1 phosphoenolpyruvate synthase [Ferruginibacter sp.]